MIGTIVYVSLLLNVVLILKLILTLLNQDIFREHYQKAQIQQHGFGIFMLMHMILIVTQVI